VLLTKSMALELSPSGVRVNCVCPAGVDTPLAGGAAASIPRGVDTKMLGRIIESPLPGMAQPSEIAEAIAYLASDAARMITGTSLLIDGGTQS